MNKGRFAPGRGGFCSSFIFHPSSLISAIIRAPVNPTWLYVAVVYAIAVWLVRRARVELPWRIAALFYLLALIFMWRPMIWPYVNVPADFIQKLPPWSKLMRHPVSGGNGILNDLPMQIMPWAHQVRESWRAGHVPLWNAHSASGYPLLANGQSSALSFIRILTLPLPLGYAFTAEAAMKLLIAMTFMFLYCRRRGWSALASTAGAASFAFCTFMTVWLHFPLATVACFVPAMLYAIDLLFERVTYGRFVFTATLWVAIIFGGHPETVAHIGFIALLYIIWIAAVERPPRAGRFFVAFAGVLAVAAILAAPFLAPFGEAITKSKRFHEIKASAMGEDAFTDLPAAIALFEPHFFGDVPVEAPWGPAHPEAITAFAGVLGVAGWFALIADAIGSFCRRTKPAATPLFFVVLTPIVLGILLNWPVIGPLFHAILPIAANGRLRLLLAFVFAIQAAALIDLIERDRTLPAAIGLFALALGFAWLMQPAHFDVEWHKPSATMAVLPSICVAFIAAIAVVIARRARPFVLMALLTAIVIEVWCSGIDWNPAIPANRVYPKTPLIAKLQQLRDAHPNAPFRICGIGSTFFPNVSAVYGLDDIRAHDPMANGRYLGLLRVISNYDPEDYFARWTDPDSPLLDFLNVRYIITEHGAQVDPARYALVYDGKDGAIYENRHVLPRFFAIHTVLLEFKGDTFIHRLLAQTDWAHVAIVKRLPVENDQNRRDLLAPRPKSSPLATVAIRAAGDTDYRLAVNAPRYTLVTSSIPYWAGWKVTANGRRLEPLQTNGTFLAFVVRPGMNDVRVWFSPPMFWISAWASLLMLAAVVSMSRESLRTRLQAALRLG
jgi:hypothetical protein